MATLGDVRRLGGLLAALGLLLAACGDGDEPTAARTADPAGAEVVDTALASATKDARGAGGAALPEGSFTVLVTSPEGVASAGLDAAVSVLIGRPDTEVVVAAPATDVRGAPGARSSTTLAIIDTETMTGFPAAAVNGGVLDVVDALGTASGGPPDLVVVGLTGDLADPTSAAMTAADAWRSIGAPVLVVSVGDDDPDLAAAGLMLSSVLDYDLDELVAAPAIHVLTVPSCDSGTVHGPISVEATVLSGLPEPDCSGHATEHDDEAGALAKGVATLARHA